MSQFVEDHPTLTKVLAWLLYFALLFIFIGAPYWGPRVFAPQMLCPVDGTTSELVMVELHWFKSSTRTKIYARFENMDLGPYPVWMARGKDGEWYRFFREPLDYPDAP